MIRFTTSDGQVAFDPATMEWTGDQVLVETIELYPGGEQRVSPTGPFVPEDRTDEVWQLLHAIEAMERSSIIWRLDEWPLVPGGDVPPQAVA